MNNEQEKLLDTLIKRITSVGFIPKSEVRILINEILKAKDKEFIEILNGLEMELNKYKCAKHKKLNNKIKQIKQKYD
ncbi:hypothetical protein LCGC14_0641320 [marine sediment metagenome]|uniref:Uncharacterized protein n=1 Tax=marine sediment metagenome TaxID=412755 RepID=A0A0F9RIF9_9ZZZZ|nr:hypothetical protein [bacterium]